MKILIALALALPVSAISATGDTHVIVHGLSRHAAPRTTGDWNEVNTGLGLRYELNDTLSIQGGVYRNSVNRQSVYSSLDWTPLSYGPVSAGVYAGVVSGYADSKYRVGGGGLIRYQADKASITLRVLPDARRNLVFSIEAGWKF